MTIFKKIESENKRTKVLSTYLTFSESEQIKKLAAARGIRVAEFLRQSALAREDGDYYFEEMIADLNMASEFLYLCSQVDGIEKTGPPPDVIIFLHSEMGKLINKIVDSI